MRIPVHALYFEYQDVYAAAVILQDAPGVMVRQPLARAGNPLAAMDYHAIAQLEMAAYPGIALPAGTRNDPTPHVKTAVLHHLRRVLAGARHGHAS